MSRNYSLSDETEVNFHYVLFKGEGEGQGQGEGAGGQGEGKVEGAGEGVVLILNEIIFGILLLHTRVVAEWNYPQ